MDLSRGKYRICYASPEILLHNPQFKKLFRTEDFRQKVVAMVVDEAHVIESWKDKFRKDYGELQMLRIIVGTEIPWLALTATCSTKTFEVIYMTLGMGVDKPFYGIDLGADRPNLALWVRPMEYAASSMVDLLAFVPTSPQSPSDFEKTIYFFKTRQLTRRACDLCRYVVAPKFQKCMYAFTAVNSEIFKDKVMDLLRDGSEVRWIFATIAAGMGTDVSDIGKSVIFGVEPLNEAFQKGGRAGRSKEMKATMIWLVEPWVLANTGTHSDPVVPGDRMVPTKKAIADAEKRTQLDPAAREFINRSQSQHCMRQFVVAHFRPQPILPGFPGVQVDRDNSSSLNQFPSITWEVVEQEIASGSLCGCSSAACRSHPDVPVGMLSDVERSVIKHHLKTLHRIRPELTPSLNEAPSSEGSDPPPSQNQPLRCSKPERENLRQALILWRDQYWSGVRSRYPFFTSEWILTNENINRLVDKAHLLLNQPQLNVDFVKGLIRSIPIDNMVLSSLVSVLKAFCTARRDRDAQEALERRPKRIYRRHQPSADISDPFQNSENTDPHLVSGAGLQMQWRVEGYSHW
jgi:hypothetical protein